MAKNRESPWSTYLYQTYEARVSILILERLSRETMEHLIWGCIGSVESKRLCL
jgi:hypothetical protein